MKSNVLQQTSGLGIQRYKDIIDGVGSSNHFNNHNFFTAHRASDFLKSDRRNSKGRNGADSGSRQVPSPAKQEHKTGDGSYPYPLERRKTRELPPDAPSRVAEFQALVHTLFRMKEEQGQTISRELHDNIAQVLTAVTARITMAREEKLPVWLRQELLALREQLEAAVNDVRTLARELRPPLLDHCGLIAALQKHAEAFRERTRMTLEVRVEPDAAQFLDGESLTHLFRLTQESLQNIEEHSGARCAWINLWQNDGSLCLEVGDDGCGFTPERVAEAQQDGHLGLLGMRERAELLGGSFLCQAAPGEGTTIRVIVPPPPQNPRRQRR